MSRQQYEMAAKSHSWTMLTALQITPKPARRTLNVRLMEVSTLTATAIVQSGALAMTLKVPIKVAILEHCTPGRPGPDLTGMPAHSEEFESTDIIGEMPSNYQPLLSRVILKYSSDVLVNTVRSKFCDQLLARHNNDSPLICCYFLLTLTLHEHLSALFPGCGTC
jgi:hypothetical protein